MNALKNIPLTIGHLGVKHVVSNVCCKCEGGVGLWKVFDADVVTYLTIELLPEEEYVTRKLKRDDVVRSERDHERDYRDWIDKNGSERLGRLIREMHGYRNKDFCEKYGKRLILAGIELIDAENITPFTVERWDNSKRHTY